MCVCERECVRERVCVCEKERVRESVCKRERERVRESESEKERGCNSSSSLAFAFYGTNFLGLLYRIIIIRKPSHKIVQLSFICMLYVRPSHFCSLFKVTTICHRVCHAWHIVGRPLLRAMLMLFNHLNLVYSDRKTARDLNSRLNRTQDLLIVSRLP